MSTVSNLLSPYTSGFVLSVLLSLSATAEHATDGKRLSPREEQNAGNGVAEYCSGEAFAPRCRDSDVIVMFSARYGRMKIGRCVKREPGFESMLQNPRYLGCSADVLEIVSGQCSGRSECIFRIPNENFENVNPNCYENLKMHLEAAYMCVNVAAETRYCTVSVSSGPQHLVDFGRTRQHSETLGSRCGDTSRPWTIDALNGQRIVVSLIDFTTESDSFVGSHSDSDLCHVTYGDVIDKTARKNVSICRRRAEQDGGRLSRVYVSQSNSLQIVLAHGDMSHHQRNFIIHVQATGCSDLVAPSDGAWLRRDGDDVMVGCYTSRQSWQLRCVDGVWTGTVGLCPQHHHYDQSLSADDEQRRQDDEMQYKVHLDDSDNIATLSIVAVSCGGIALCLIVVCVGVACLIRQNRQLKEEKSASDVERLKPMNGTIDSHSINDDVNLQWQQQQRQQLFM